MRLLFPRRFLFPVIVCDVSKLELAMVDLVDLRTVTRQGISNPGLKNEISRIRMETGANITHLVFRPCTSCSPETAALRYWSARSSLVAPVK